MNGRNPARTDPPPPPPHAELYSDVLHEAKDVRDKAIDRLHRLCDRFPAAVPPLLLDQLERSRTDPRAERRATVRFDGGPTRVTVRAGSDPVRRTRAVVLDRSAGGLRLQVRRPHPLGSALSVRLRADGRRTWYAAVVRYCRRVGEEWELGCEFQGARPTG
jgi:hypothetical protein